MKKRRLFGVGVVALLQAVGTTSCQGLLYNNRAGQVIQFSASAANGTGTKTEYAGTDEDGGVVNNRERINWKKDDQVKIYLFLDNAPDYFFDGENKEMVSDYLVTLTGPGTGDDAYKSRGKLSAIGDTDLRWVGTEDNVDVVDHWFYSVYPAKLSGWSVSPDPDSYSTATITFPDLSEQDGSMDYAYMAAAAGPYKTGTVLENREKEDGTVNLDYYPMVTTVYVTFDNKSSRGKIPAEFLTLSVNDGYDQPLAGGYNLEYSGGEGGTLGTITNGEQSISLPTIEADIEESIPFFLIPRTYSAGELTIKIGENSYPLNEKIVLLPFHKYNVTVTINENGEAELPEIGDASESLSQLVCALLREMCNSGMWDMLEDFFRALGYSDTPDGKSARNHFEEEFYGPFSSDIDTLSPSKEGWKDLVSRYLEEESWAKLLECFGELENIVLTTSPGILADELTAEDMKIFKSARKMELFLNNDITINIKGLDNLEEFVIHNGSNGHIDLTFTDCPNLTTFTDNGAPNLDNLKFENCGIQNLNLKKIKKLNISDCVDLVSFKIDEPNNQSFQSLSIVNAPKFKNGQIGSLNDWGPTSVSNISSVSITLIDCSTNVDNATLTIWSDQNTRPQGDYSNSNHVNIILQGWDWGTSQVVVYDNYPAQ